MFNIFILLYLSVVYTVANPERCNTIIAQSSISNNECSELKVCYDTLCGCGRGLFTTTTTECQRWKKHYNTDATCKVQCGAAQEVISGIPLPPSIIMFPTDTPSSGRRLALDDDTDYSKLIQKSSIYSGPASDSLQFVDFLVCMLSNTNAVNHTNELYTARIDETLCQSIPEENGRPLWMTIALNVSRSSHHSPMTIRGWVTTAEGEKIVFWVRVTGAPSKTTPNGVFSLTYNFVPSSNFPTTEHTPLYVPTHKGFLEFWANGEMILIEQFVDDSDISQTHQITGRYPFDETAGGYQVFNGKNFEYVFDSTHIKIYGDDGIEECFSKIDMFGSCRTKLYDFDTGKELKLEEAFEFTAQGERGWWNHRTPAHETTDTGFTLSWIWYSGTSLLQNDDTITRTLDNRKFTIQGMDWTVGDCDYSDAANACKSSTEITLEDSAGETFSLDAPISLTLTNEQSDGAVTSARHGASEYPASTSQSFKYPGESGLQIFNSSVPGGADDYRYPRMYECRDGDFPATWEIPVTDTDFDNCVEWRRIFHIQDGTLLKHGTNKYRVKNAECTNFLVRVVPDAFGTTTCDSLVWENDVPTNDLGAGIPHNIASPSTWERCANCMSGNHSIGPIRRNLYYIGTQGSSYPLKVVHGQEV